MVVAYHYYNGHVKSDYTNYMKLSHKVMIIIAFYGCGLPLL